MQIMEAAGLAQVIGELTSTSNEVRSAAEAKLEAVPAPQRAQALFQYASQAGDDENRSLALVLLRRLLSSSWEEVWPAFGEAQGPFKAELLLRLKREDNEVLRKRVADVVAEVARNSLDENVVWTEALEFLHASVAEPHVHLKVAALSILESVPSIFGVQQAKYLSVIKEMLGTTLQSESAEVRSAAVRAATSFLCDNEEDQQTLSACQPLVPLILKVCQAVVVSAANDGDADDDTPLQCLGDLATSLPKSLKPHLADVAQLCVEVCNKADLDDALRHSALEVMVSLCESSAAMMRKRGAAYVGPLVKICLDLMVELEDDEDWHTADDLDSDDDNNAAVGETSLDRVATSLGGKAVFPPVIALVPAMMQSAEWTQRHAGLMALSTVGEGCKKVMEARIVEIVASIVPFVRDPHPRVRYAACNALGQMSTDFAPVIEKKCHDSVIPALVAALEDMGNPRVAAHAASAIVNFAEECPKDILLPYLDPLMEKLETALQQTFKMLEGGKKLVLEQVITTIASVADTAQDHYVRYYDRVMPNLKFILANASGAHQLRLLRGKCIECISLIGLAVGREKFLPDAGEVMELLLKSQAEFGQGDDDDPSTSYVISASARICKLLGEDFAQYLPIVMPAVMKAAELKPEVTVVDAEDGDDMAGDEEWTFVGVGDQSMLGIKTAGLEDKANACQMLVCYARELKHAFAEYVEPVTKLMVPLLKFYFHDGVRSAASESLPYLLGAAEGKGPEFVKSMWEFIFPDLLKAVEEEPENEVTADHLWGLFKCIEALGAGCLEEGKMAAVFEVLKKLLEKHFEKASERATRRADEDHDEEQESELLDADEEDSYVVSKVSDVVHAAFGTHGPAVAHFFASLLPHLQEMLKPGRAYGDRQWALCLFDDLIEFAPAESPKYRELFVPHMMAGLGDAHAEVRQAAAYGFGVLGLQGEAAFSDTVVAALPALGAMIEAEGSRDSAEASEATENAVSAVCKILKHHPGAAAHAQPYVARLAAWLPTWEDKEEAPHIYGYFADLMEGNDATLLGPDNAHLPQLLLIMGTAFEKEAFDEAAAPTAARLARLVRLLQGNDTVFANCAQRLPESTQQALAQALQTYPQ